MTQKTLLALGGSRLLMPLIDVAHDMGHRVVTCDYLPDNYAHSFADDYRNVSITDLDAVLATAKDCGADGIVSWAADPGVVAAAYAAEHLGLPFQGSFEAARTLQDKAAFRDFLRRHDLPSPQARTYTSSSVAADESDAIEYPVIVKPTDAAGSKGVTRVNAPEQLQAAVDTALSFSLRGEAVVETYIIGMGRQISAEGFLVDGRWGYIGFMDQMFDDDGPNPYAPVGNILPSQMDPDILEQLTRDLQRIADLLNLTSGIFNIECRVDTNRTPHILELSPRGGGNRLAEFIRCATGIDLITATVEAALGHTITSFPRSAISGVWVQQMLYSRTAGVFDGIRLNPDFERNHIVEITPSVNLGDPVMSFGHASFALGSAFQRFDSYADAIAATNWPHDNFALDVRPSNDVLGAQAE